MTNAELIATLRGENYFVTLLHDAADALEAAEKRIAEMEKGYSWKAYAALEESIEGYKTRIAELEARMPKEGEWIEANTRPRSAQFVCSVCHRTAYDIQPTRNKAWTKRCRYAYCPNCGARMDGDTENASTYSLGKIEMPKGAMKKIIADGERKDGERKDDEKTAD